MSHCGILAVCLHALWVSEDVATEEGVDDQQEDAKDEPVSPKSKATGDGSPAGGEGKKPWWNKDKSIKDAQQATTAQVALIESSSSYVSHVPLCHVGVLHACVPTFKAGRFGLQGLDFRGLDRSFCGSAGPED